VFTVSIQIRGGFVLRVGLHDPDMSTSTPRRVERVAKGSIGQRDPIDQDDHRPPAKCRLPGVRNDHHGTGRMPDDVPSGATLEQADRPWLVGIRSDHDGSSFSTEPIKGGARGAADDRGLQRWRRASRVHVFHRVLDHLLRFIAVGGGDIESVGRPHGRRGYDIRVDESKWRIPSLRLFEGVVQDGGVLFGDSCNHRCVVSKHAPSPSCLLARPHGRRRHLATTSLRRS
jgi:hypothetical protein